MEATNAHQSGSIKLENLNLTDENVSRLPSGKLKSLHVLSAKILMVLCVRGLNGTEALLDPLSDGGRGTCVDGGGCNSGSSPSSPESEEPSSLSLPSGGVLPLSC